MLGRHEFVILLGGAAVMLLVGAAAAWPARARARLRRVVLRQKLDPHVLPLAPHQAASPRWARGKKQCELFRNFLCGRNRHARTDRTQIDHHATQRRRPIIEFQPDKAIFRLARNLTSFAAYH
jgi:hypothetical protein